MEEMQKNIYNPDVTILSNKFLEEYLQDANSEYIKVYIYYLWKCNGKIDIDFIADGLSLTENDVSRAIKYWIKKGVICDTLKEEKKEENKIINSDNVVKFQDIKDKIQSEADEKVIKDLVFFAEKLFPNTISKPQLDAIKEMYYELNLQPEVIEYLIEYVASNDCPKPNYMIKIATSWHEQGVKTKEDAKKFVEKYANYKKPKKANKNNIGMERHNGNKIAPNEFSFDTIDISK